MSPLSFNEGEFFRSPATIVRCGNGRTIVNLDIISRLALVIFVCSDT